MSLAVGYYERWKAAGNTCLKDGTPCSRPGCLRHVTHPCEGCGRVGGKSWTILAYCEEEVSRQGHDVVQPEGLIRVAWMLEAWCAMLHTPYRPLTVTDIVGLGAFVERDVNRNGFRTCGVRVGPSVIPGSPSALHDCIARLLAMSSELEPLEFYRAFEEIHPFQDGNGRVGKILLNWKAGTLLTPFFPPNDFWGGVEIRNP